jgi:hypothetical protein
MVVLAVVAALALIGVALGVLIVRACRAADQRQAEWLKRQISVKSAAQVRDRDERGATTATAAVEQPERLSA